MCRRLPIIHASIICQALLTPLCSWLGLKGFKPYSTAYQGFAMQTGADPHGMRARLTSAQVSLSEAPRVFPLRRDVHPPEVCEGSLWWVLSALSRVSQLVPGHGSSYAITKTIFRLLGVMLVWSPQGYLGCYLWLCTALLYLTATRACCTLPPDAHAPLQLTGSQRFKLHIKKSPKKGGI